MNRILANYERTVRGGHVILSPGNIPGEFRLCATSHLAQRIILSGEYEPEVTAHLEQLLRQNGGECINIGANIGLMSIYLAQLPLVTKVLAIEPNLEAFELLEQNIIRNRQSGRVIPLRTCLGSKKGEVTLSTIPGKPEYSSIDGIVHRSTEGQVQTAVRVPCDTLDNVVKNHDLHPSLLLIDTEGAEYLVISGAKQILREFRPTVLFELSHPLLEKFGNKVVDILAVFDSLGYLVQDMANGKKITDPYFDGEAIAIPHKCD